MTSHVAHPPRSSAARWLGLAAFGAAVTAAALIGVLGVAGTSAEYQSLEQPSWAPPPWLFGPVWTVLYAMIAVAGWLVWRRVGFDRSLVPGRCLRFQHASDMTRIDGGEHVPVSRSGRAHMYAQDLVGQAAGLRWEWA